MNSNTQTVSRLLLEVIPDIPLIEAGAPLSRIIFDAITAAGLKLVDGDVLVVAQKIVSKAEGRLVRLDAVAPSEEARSLAAETEKDSAVCQLILDESAAVLRKKPGVIIVRHRLGHVGANAGIDQSNIEHGDGEAALLLPVDPDGSALRLCNDLSAAAGCKVGIIISDSMNRPWRLGTVGGAIGCAGVQVLDDLRGGQDLFGRELKVAMVNRADSLAATATLLMGETIEGTPAVLIRGLPDDSSTGTADELIRPLEDDL
ncbi:MAG: coenzyme F420-0:L-glutamate ligase, partial [Gammaproteobacteria bacterium]|nr:coenzyme F420-0:L-glutamate ligase [Gammaproteobacteria bacterium]